MRLKEKTFLLVSDQNPASDVLSDRREACIRNAHGGELCARCLLPEASPMSLVKSALILFVLLSFSSVLPAFPQLEPSWPPDSNAYRRSAVPEDENPRGKPAIGPRQFDTPNFPNVFVRDTVVSNTDPTLTSTDQFGDSEPAIAINVANTSEIVITAFSGFNWTNPGTSLPGDAPLWLTTDGGNTWTKEETIPSPEDVYGKFCPCDQTVDYGRSSELFGSFLTVNPTNIYSGSTINPADVSSWQWPVQKHQATLTDFGAPNHADQPWLLVNPDPFVSTQDNAYVAYDDFSGGCCSSPTLRVSTALGTAPPFFVRDVLTGVSSPFINPGHRLAADRSTGFVYELYQVRIAPGADGISQNINFVLNRSTDGGATWGLNGSATGIVVANADSTQPRPKFGTVNALLGGVDHVAVDHVTGDVYVVHGNRDARTGNNRLSIVRLVNDGNGGLAIANRAFITGQVQAALPSVAVNASGIVGVLYDTFDGFSSTGFPIFSAHLAISRDQGSSFSDQVIETFLSPTTDNGNGRQRVLGDYQQLKSLGNIFYGTFTGNGVPFGRPFANMDAMFFKTSVQ